MIERWKRLKSWFSQRFDPYSEWTDGPDAKVSLGRLWTGIGFIAVLALIGTSVWALFRFPPWYVNESVGPQVLRTPVRAFELENETRKTFTQIVLGFWGAVALSFVWRRVKAGEKTAEVAEQGHITERYTKAIEQLGKLENGEPNIEVRLGAIYALERIAIDSPRDHQTIMEVLCAYVRRNAIAPTAQSESAPAGDEDGDEDPYGEPCEAERPRIDIQAILTVIGRRPRGKRREKEPFQIELDGAYLKGSYLYRVHLEGASLGEAHLEASGLFEAHLQGANLHRAHLENAYISNAHLEGANLYRVCLEGANLSNAHLEGADLRRAHLEGAAGLTVEQVKSAKNWELAHYDPEFRRKLGLPDEQ